MLEGVPSRYSNAVKVQRSSYHNAGLAFFFGAPFFPEKGTTSASAGPAPAVDDGAIFSANAARSVSICTFVTVKHVNSEAVGCKDRYSRRAASVFVLLYQ